MSGTGVSNKINILHLHMQTIFMYFVHTNFKCKFRIQILNNILFYIHTHTHTHIYNF